MYIVKLHMSIFTFSEFTGAKEMHLKYAGLLYIFIRKI